MVLILAFARGKNSLNVRGLIEVHPQAAHGVVHPGENLHRSLARVVAEELFVDLQDSFELAVERGAINVREVEIDHRLAVNAEIVLENDLEDGTRGYVARHQVSILRIPFLEEVPAFLFWNQNRVALVSELFWDPYAPALTTRRLRHQAQLIFTGNAGRVHLNKLAVGVVAALLIESRLGRAGADNRIR